MWTSNDFLGSGPLESLSYRLTISTVNGTNNNSDVHFLIQTADLNYYASNDLDQGSQTLSTPSANWNTFNPLTNGVASVGASVGTIDMSEGNIIGVGYYAESRSNTASTMRHYTWYFQATAVPEAGTLGLFFIGLGALGYARKRQRA